MGWNEATANTIDAMVNRETKQSELAADRCRLRARRSMASASLDSLWRAAMDKADTQNTRLSELIRGWLHDYIHEGEK